MTVQTAPFSLGRAEDFVLANGDPRRKATWKAAFGCGPVEVLVFELEPRLSAEGVWSGLAPAGGELASAIAALRVLSALNLGEDIFEVGERAAARLLALRGEDGSWDEAAPWPGVDAVRAAGVEDDAGCRRAWHTAAIGLLLPQLTGSTDADRTLAAGDGAARWLVAHAEDLHHAGPAAWWAALGCLGRSAEPGAAAAADDQASKLLGWLQAPRPASDLAWIHEACRLAGRPADDPLRLQAWTRLAASQEADGGWAAGSDAGWPVDRVDATIFATRAVVRP